MAKRKKITTKSKIIQAAWKLFYKQGYENTTVDEIIDASNTSKGSFYHYFESKDALLSTLSYLFDDKYEELAAEMPDTFTAQEKLSFLNHELFRMIDESIDVNLLSRLYSSQLITKAEQHLLDENRFYFRLIIQIISDGYQHHEFRSGLSVDELVKLYVMYERGVIYDWCLNKASYSIMEYSDRILPDFLRMLEAPEKK
ncbi:MAG TPA: TetR/AcrR family transcriptional regulator [Lachnospiraceae bacterium]|nr:TetR/AcrR family transcriptional regulator [Lachnospiraceae bacterium]